LLPSTSAQLADFFRNIDSCRDKGTLTHQLHPYPAKFIPHIPRTLITHLGIPDQPILDPMCGSGTTLVEASASGYPSIGFDLNPIAVLAARAKTSPLDELDLKEIEVYCRRLDSGSGSLPVGCPPTFINRDKWFLPHVQAELAAALEGAMELTRVRAHVLVLASFSAIVVPVSNQESETRWCAKPQSIAPGETLTRLARKIRKSVLAAADFARHASGPSVVVRTDSRKLPLCSASIGLVVTSPPYANSHDYYLYNKLRMFWLGYPVDQVQEAEIGSRNRHSDRRAEVTHYLDAMEDILRESQRVLVPGGHAVFVVADSVIRGEFFDMGEEYRKLACNAGFATAVDFEFAHKKFNSSFQTGFGTDQQKMTHVLVFKKHE